MVGQQAGASHLGQEHAFSKFGADTLELCGIHAVRHRGGIGLGVRRITNRHKTRPAVDVQPRQNMADKESDVNRVEVLVRGKSPIDWIRERYHAIFRLILMLIRTLYLSLDAKIALRHSWKDLLTPWAQRDTYPLCGCPGAYNVGT